MAKNRAAQAANAAVSAVGDYRRRQAAADPAQHMYETGLQRYPEFKPLVDKIVRAVVTEINAEARKIESGMPYKAQFTLEEVIRELQDRV